MSVLTVVGPPGVGKTYLAKSIAEKVGEDYCSYHECPPSYDNPAFEPLSYHDLYEWSFSMTHLIAQGNENHLFILDGFPHPEAWAFSRGEKWSVIQTNMEERLRMLNSRQIILLPTKWKKWETMAIRDYHVPNNIAYGMRDSWDMIKKKTKIITAVIPNSEVAQEKINQLIKGLGV